MKRIVCMKKIVLSFSAIAVIVLMLIFPDKSIGYVRSSLELCYEMIIPTLFPFFICSGILIYSGFCETLSKCFRFCMKPLFGVSPAGASAFVLGIISGYPLGAVTAGQLYEGGYISKVEAERLCAFCNNSGPLFVIGSVGAAVYGNIRLGIMLYATHILAALTVGIIFRFYKRADYSAPPTVMTTPDRSVGEVISIALNNAVSNMLVVCGAVVFFGMAGRLIIDLLPLDGALYAVASGIIEFVNGTVKTAGLDVDMGIKLVMTAFIVGFAGMSVHAQVIAVIARYGFSLVPYFVGKLLHGILAALYTMICLSLFPVSEAVFAPGMGIAFGASSSYTALSAAVMVLLGGVFAVGMRMGKGSVKINEQDRRNSQPRVGR
jgi:sporulation integral membrane protein YlbJ